MTTHVKQGKATSVIRIAPWAQEHEAFAAQELSRYFEAMSGTGLDLKQSLRGRDRAIVLADLSHPATSTLLPKRVGDGLRYDGFRILTQGQRVYIVSKEAGGLVFGTYEYLRRVFGCAFLDYGPRGETIPRHAELSHGALDITDNPACWYRGLQSTVAEEPASLTQRLDWMAKNGFSHVLVHFSNGFAAMLGRPVNAPEELLAETRTWLIPELAKRGLKLAVGHHLFDKLVSWEQFGDERPDFFTEVDGKRVRQPQIPWCLANEDLIETVAQRVLELARMNPEADTIEFWPDDGVSKLCECADCARLDRPVDEEDTDWPNLYGQRKDRLGRRGLRRKMRRYLHLANRVAERLAETYPTIKLSILAYADLIDVPLREIEIHPNVVVCMAIYWRCSKHDLVDSRCAINRQYVEIIREWTKVIEPHRLYFYSYEMGMGAWQNLPYPILTSLFADWPWLKSVGVGGTHIQSTTKHVAVYGMNYLAVARLLREDAPTLSAFMDGYCRSFFGPAAKPMLSLYRRLEKGMRTARSAHVRPSAMMYLKKILSPDDLAACRRDCDKALALTDDTLQRWRIERVRGIVDYCDVYRRAPAALLRFLEKGKISRKEQDQLERWIEKVRSVVQPHLIMDDDVFAGDLTQKMRKRYLGQI